MVLVAVDALQEREIARARWRERAVCVCVFEQLEQEGTARTR